MTGTTLRFIPPVWTSGTAYTMGQIVQNTFGISPNDGVYWIANADHTAGSTNAPGVFLTGQPQLWTQWFGSVHGDAYSHTTTYYNGELTYVSSTWYLSKANANTGNDSTGTPNGSFWVAQPAGSAQWIDNYFVAAGAGVTVNGRARNLFPLPNGYLRILSPDPKVESTATNVTSASLRFLDWELEGDYLISNSSDPITSFRFVADVSDVSRLDPLLCEALAARIAYSVCEILTQSNVKLAAIGQAYQHFMADARMINLLETGSTEPEESAYLLSNGPAGVTDNSGGGAQNAGPQGQ